MCEEPTEACLTEAEPEGGDQMLGGGRLGTGKMWINGCEVSVRLVSEEYLPQLGTPALGDLFVLISVPAAETAVYTQAAPVFRTVSLWSWGTWREQVPGPCLHVER